MLKIFSLAPLALATIAFHMYRSARAKFCVREGVTLGGFQAEDVLYAQKQKSMHFKLRPKISK